MPKPAATVLIVAAALGLTFMLVVFGRDYGSAPDVVATHFGVTGTPDAWGPKSTFVIFPIMGIVFFGVAVTIAAVGLPARGAPVPAVLPILACLMLVEVLWMLAFAEMGSFDVALGRAAGLSPGFFIGLAAVMLTAIAMLVTVLVFVIRRFRSR